MENTKELEALWPPVMQKDSQRSLGSRQPCWKELLEFMQQGREKEQKSQSRCSQDSTLEKLEAGWTCPGLQREVREGTSNLPERKMEVASQSGTWSFWEETGVLRHFPTRKEKSLLLDRPSTQPQLSEVTWYPGRDVVMANNRDYWRTVTQVGWREQFLTHQGTVHASVASVKWYPTIILK